MSLALFRGSIHFRFPVPLPRESGREKATVSPDLENLLRETSRSFYLTLRILPAAVRWQIGLAYLLARATDTIADTELVPVADRLKALAELRQRIEGTRTQPLDLAPLLAAQPHHGPSAERRLLGRIEDALNLLFRHSTEDQADIRSVLATITRGQTLDLERFGGASGASPVALRQNSDLDEYTYLVAGCVGEFWTRMTRRHCFPQVSLDDARFLDDGIRFGKGLQLTNILRDLPRDLAAGRCYLPAAALSAVKLQPRDLLDLAQENRLRPLYDEWLGCAEGHLRAGWNYTLTVPESQRRLRLACAWPILIGLRTLTKLRTGPVLDSRVRIKVSRAEVRSIILGSIWRLPFREAWEGQFARALRGN